LLNACIGGYRLVDFLGAGGMGEVYRAVHVKLGRVVAIKVLSASGQGPGFLPRFENEARLQATLQHPNIATLYDFFEFEGRPSIVMEFVEGQSLAEILGLRWRLPADEALGILRDIASAIAYVHEKGIVHRDIKPANIRLTPNGTVKVLDFGIAKDASVPGLTQTGLVVGTPQYLAPEQFTSGRASPQSDVWALGVLLYEMVTGRLPFEGEFAGQIWKQIDTGAYPRTADLVAPESSAEAARLRDVDRIVGCCLKKNPAGRYRSAKLLLDDVSAAIASRQVSGGGAGGARRSGDANQVGPISQSRGASILRDGLNAIQTAAGRALGVLERYWLAFAATAAALLVVLVVVSFVLSLGGPGREESGAESAGRSVYRIDVAEGRAEVYVNGVRKGRTPFDYAATDNEVIDLELRQPGFLIQRERFDVSERQVWTFAMKKSAGKE
jgi:serine/threonine-protein kinase